jgi:vanillate monooxygenase ferredoxin subunit
VSAQLFCVKVVRKTQEADDICVFELAHSTGSPLPAFTAGAHVNVQGPTGVIRQYSLCNKPGETDRYVIGVLKEPSSRGGSLALHESVREGDTLHISRPNNQFALAPTREHSLLLAGGIGITPLLCMAEELAAKGASFEMHYCTRSPSRTAFLDYLKTCHFASSVQFHFDDGAHEQKLDLVSLLRQPSRGFHLYACGPAGFLAYVLQTAERSGWDKDHLHYESFSAPGGTNTTTSNEEFDIKIASTGKVIHVASSESIAAALAKNGIAIPLSCEQGVCGTCLTKVLDGVPDHRDVYLSEEEHARNDQLMPCCSRSKTPILVLDL